MMTIFVCLPFDGVSRSEFESEILIFLLEHIKFNHIVLFQVSDFFVQTPDLYVLKLFFVVLCLLVPIFEVAYVFLQNVSFLLEVLDDLVLFLSVPLQVLAHFFKLPNGAVQVVE